VVCCALPHPPAQDGKVLVVTFEKAVHTWWRSVVEGHPEIDATLVDSTRRVEDYDDETQATIRKIMHEQRTQPPQPPPDLPGPC
jgi:hypothetical protein